MKIITLLAAIAIACATSGCGGGGDSSSNAPATAGSSAPLTSSIGGTVTDQSGAPIVGATVIAYLTNDHTDHVATTDSTGHYGFTGLSANLPYGSYEVRVEKSGLGFYPSTASASASVVKADYNALFRMVIAVPSHGSQTVTDANFIAMQAGEHRVSVARTGQTMSYVSGDDASAASGTTWPSTRFVDNADGTITDRLTGLIWMKDAGCINVSNWANALTAAKQLANGACGLTDHSTAGQWRMPNIGELESLVDISRSNPALPAAHPFTNVGNFYWSSTTYRGVPMNAWVIRFSDGRYINDSAGNFKATAMNGLWAVRTGTTGTVPLPATGQFIVYGTGDDAETLAGVSMTYPRFIDKGDGTVSDTVTGLTWLKRADCIHQTWSNAVASINALANGQCGLSDGSTAGQWRMPNRNELLSLVDRAETNQALRFNTVFYKSDGSVDQPVVFRSYIENEFYWTSSTNAADTTEAWTVYSCDFGVYDIAKTNIGYTLAVR